MNNNIIKEKEGEDVSYEVLKLNVTKKHVKMSESLAIVWLRLLQIKWHHTFNSVQFISINIVLNHKSHLKELQ